MPEQRYFGFLIVLCSLLVCGGKSAASPVRFEFTGQITGLEVSTCCLTVEDVFGDVIEVGDGFTGRFRYESEAPVSQVTSSNFTVYRSEPPEFDVEISFGSTFATARQVPSALRIGSVAVTDAFIGVPPGIHIFAVNASITATRGRLPANSSVAHLGLSLRDLSASVFASVDLPTILALDDFSSATMRLQSRMPANNWAAIGRIDTLVLVPEPGTLLLTLPAIILVLAYRAGRGSRMDHRS